jgi:hypothetical protein
MTGYNPTTAFRAPPLLLLTLLGLACQGGTGDAASRAEVGASATSTPGANDSAGQANALNTLTPQEVAEGWQLLFDGQTTRGWRGYNKDAFPEVGWGVEDGDLVVMASDGSEEGLGGDIVTEAEFSDFELVFDFLITPVGNSGVFFRVQEHPDRTLWQVAPEYQVLDDSAYIGLEGFDPPTHLTGDNYDLHAATIRAMNPIGEWNRGRIVVDGNHVEHWLNGKKTVEYELYSPEWEALVAKSKFAPYPEYARAVTGRIGLQDHGHELRYRNIKIRPF